MSDSTQCRREHGSRLLLSQSQLNSTSDLVCAFAGVWLPHARSTDALFECWVIVSATVAPYEVLLAIKLHVIAGPF